MTKAEIVTKIAKKTGLEKDAVLTVIESFMETVKESLAKGEEVTCYDCHGYCRQAYPC